jgi:hypothetical protein
MILLLALLVPACGWSAIAANTLALYNMEDKTDSSGNGFTMTDYGAGGVFATEPTPPTGAKSLSITSVNSQLAPAGVYNGLSGISAFTIECYIYKKRPTGVVHIITRSDASAGLGYFELRIENNDPGTLNWGTYTGAWQQVTAANAIALNTWYHVAGTYNAGTMRLYINGTEVGTAKTGLASTTGTLSSMRIGCDTSSYLVGNIDQLRFSTVARTTFPTVDPADVVAVPPNASPFLRNLITPILGPLGFK